MEETSTILLLAKGVATLPPEGWERRGGKKGTGEQFKD
jgi:hypothetical protein